MDYFKLVDFRQLKAFFLALKQGHFKTDSRQTSATVIIDGIRTPVDKKHCLKLLRSFPDFQGDQFNDDGFLIRYLSNPTNLQRILGRFTTEQQLDLKKVLETTAISEEVGQLPVAGEVPAEQTAPVGTTGSAPMGGIPSTPSISSPVPRRIFITEQTTPPSAGKAGGTGQGTAATNKAAGLIAKEEVPSAFQKAFENEPEHALDPTKQPPSPSAPSGKGPSAPKFQAPRVPYSFTNAAKNFGSSASIFTKKGGNRLMGGLSNMLGGAGRAGGDMLGGAIGRGGRALGNLGLKGIDFGARFSSAVSTRGSLVKTSSKKAVFIFLGAFLLFALFAGLTGSLTPPGQPSTQVLTSPTSGDISSCKFTRTKTPNLVKSSVLQGSILNAANAAGIPPAVLASVAMHESPSLVATTDNNHEALTSGNYCNYGKQFCEKNGRVLHSKDGQDDPCTTDEITNGARTAKAVGLMQIIDIYNQDASKDLCKITDSLTIAANKLKNDGITMQPTQDQINTAIKKYYNSCDYGSYSYCDEVWEDFQNCKVGSNVAVDPVPQEKLDQILYWARIINNALESGNPPSSWNRMVKNIINGTYTATTRTAEDRGVGPTGIYWCTNIVIDSYNLSGLTGLGPGHQSVRNMIHFWQGTPGYVYIPYNGLDSIRQTKAGNALFRLYEGNLNLDHTSIISYIYADQRGNGSIKTLDSNGLKAWSSTVEDGKILETGFFPKIVGFGGIQ